jgi:hypothetical protein
LLQMISAERHRRSQAQRWVVRSLEHSIRTLTRELKLIDREIAQRLSRSPLSSRCTISSSACRVRARARRYANRAGA